MKKIKLQIKNRWTGNILFEYEKEDNTIRQTIEKAVEAGADLTGAYLTGADLTGADLTGAYLKGAYLKGADLTGADLTGAYLTGADLKGADLTGAYLKGADLTGACLSGAYLKGADLTGAKDVPYIPLACPSDGAFIGWKKAHRNESEVLVKLEIPEDAKRSSATGTKCRCDKARVLEITRISDNEQLTAAVSNLDIRFIYTVGHMVSVPDFDDNRFNEFAPGIHFFINKQDAINYK